MNQVRMKSKLSNKMPYLFGFLKNDIHLGKVVVEPHLGAPTVHPCKKTYQNISKQSKTL